VPYPLTTPDSLTSLVDVFLETYARRYGEESVPESAGLELVTFAVEAHAALPRPQLRMFDESGPDASAAHAGEREVWDAAARATAPTAVYEGERLRPGNYVAGPAVIEYDTTTVALTSGQIAVVDTLLNLSIRRDV
jgi:N-methylhydantoinase A